MHQLGMTLIEMITSLAILALVIGGALALFNSASISQRSMQMNSDLNSVRTAVQVVYFGQKGYGTAANLNSVLIAGKRIPSTMVIAGNVVTHAFNGTMTVIGNIQNFDVVLTNMPVSACLSALSGANGWKQVQVATGIIQTVLPISPSTAATECAKGTTITFSSN